MMSEMESPLSYYYATLLAMDRSRSQYAYLIETVTPGKNLCGKSEERNVWAVVVVDKPHREALKRALSDKDITQFGTRLPLEDYGTVIMQDCDAPPDNIRDIVLHELRGNPPPENELYL